MAEQTSPLASLAAEVIALDGLQVCPRPAGQQIVDGRASDAVLSRKATRAFSTFGAVAYLQDLSARQFAVAMVLANYVALSSLCDHVVNVVNLSAEKQVVWPNASGHVAPVQDAHLAWDRPVVQRPGNAMRCEAAWSRGSPARASVPEVKTASRPQPAPVRLANLAPESRDELLVCARACDDVFVHDDLQWSSCSEGRAGTTPVRLSALYQTCGLDAALKQIGEKNG